MSQIDVAAARKNAILPLYTRFPAINLYEYVNKRFTRAADAAAIMRCAKESISKWKDPDHYIDVTFADRFACRLGVHPCVIWPELWFEVSPEKEQAACRRREKQKARRERLAAMSSQ